MKTDKKGNTIVIKYTQGNLNSFIIKLSNELDSYQQENVIIDLTEHKNMEMSDVLLFSDLSEKKKALKKSFVIVVNDLDFGEVPDEMIVVPTILEAHDIITMEEIERDLDF